MQERQYINSQLVRKQTLGISQSSSCIHFSVALQHGHLVCPFLKVIIMQPYVIFEVLTQFYGNLHFFFYEWLLFSTAIIHR